MLTWLCLTSSAGRHITADHSGRRHRRLVQTCANLPPRITEKVQHFHKEHRCLLIMSVRSRKPVSGKEPEDRSPQSRNVSGATSGSDARLFSAPPPYLPFESEAETSVSTPLLPEEDGNELGSTPVWSIGTEGGWLRCCVEPSRAAEFLYRPTPPDGGVEVRGGLQAAGTGLAFGIYDGVTGLFTQPYLGGKKGGVKGVAKGFGMGLGGLVCKPAGGACGFVGFAWEGLEADVGRWREGRGAEADASSRRVGEMAQEWLGRSAAVDASDEERRRVLKLWRSMEA